MEADLLWTALALLFYVTALYVAVMRIVKEHRAPSRIVNLLLALGGFQHLLGIILTGHPLAILAHVLSELALLILIIYFIMIWRGKWGALAIFIIPTIIILSLFSLLLPHQVEGVSTPHLLFALHVVTILAGIGGIFTGFFYTLLYIIQERSIKRHLLGTWSHLIPSLAACERFAWRSLLGGWYLYTIGIFLGTLWSHISRGPWFIYSSKQAGGLAAWVIFALLIFFHRTLHWRGRRTLLIYLLGFIAVIVAMVGIRIS